MSNEGSGSDRSEEEVREVEIDTGEETAEQTSDEREDGQADGARAQPGEDGDVIAPGLAGGERVDPEEADVDLEVPDTDEHPLEDVMKVLRQEIVGQDRAIRAIGRALLRAEADMRDPHKPIAVFFFAGPTGVGKTETVKALAKALHGDFREMIKVDCSEYSEPHSISRLVGSPPGYIGSDQPPILSQDAIGDERNRIILFDEVEKAHFRLHNLLLQIMDEGRLTLASQHDEGREVDMTNCIIVLTSNVGASAIEQTIMDNRIGFKTEEEGDVEETDQQIYESAKQAFQRSFSPEFRNRITEFIVFRPLARESLYQILQKLLQQSANRFARMGFSLHVTPKARDWLIEKGVNVQLGVRPLVKTIEKYVETKLAEYHAWGLIEPGDFVVCDINEAGDGLSFRRAERTEQQKERLEQLEAEEAETEAVELEEPQGETEQETDSSRDDDDDDNGGVEADPEEDLEAKDEETSPPAASAGEGLQ